MPGFDGTGPMGMGPMTGGGRGFCAVPNAGTVPRFVGRRFFGRGGGRGWRNWYYATGLPGWMRAGSGYPYGVVPTAKEESEMLQEEASFLKQQLADIQNRLSVLEKEQQSK